MAESNKDKAVSFLKLAASEKVDESYTKFVAAGFLHHTPYFEGTADALKAGMGEDALHNPDKALEVKLGIAEGEYVVVFTHIRQHSPELERLGE